MAFAAGEPIGAALERATPETRESLRRALLDLVRQCHVLDASGIDKSEMHRCARHVILDGDACTLLDFERCSDSTKPQNVTGIAQYLSQTWAADQLRRANILVDVTAVRAASKAYKHARSDHARVAVETALGLHSESPTLAAP